MALINSCQLCTSRTSGTFTVVCGTPLSLDSQYFVIHQLVLYQLTMIMVNSIVTFPWLFRGFYYIADFDWKGLTFGGFRVAMPTTSGRSPSEIVQGRFCDHILSRNLFRSGRFPDEKTEKCRKWCKSFLLTIWDVEAAHSGCVTRTTSELTCVACSNLFSDRLRTHAVRRQNRHS